MHIYNQGFTRELYRIDTILWFLDSLVQISWSFVDQLQQAPRQHHGCQHQVWKAHLTRSWLARCVGFRNLWKTWDRRDNSISICGLCSATLSYVVTFWHFTLQKTTGKGNRAHQVGWSIPILQMWFSSPQTPRNYSLVTQSRLIPSLKIGYPRYSQFQWIILTSLWTNGNICGYPPLTKPTSAAPR